MDKKSNKYLIEGLLFLSYVFFGMSWAVSTGFLPQIKADLHITTLSQASWLSNVVSIAKIVGTFVAAGILARLGAKKAVTISLALMALGIFTGMASSFAMLLVIRFLVGLGGAFIVVFMPPLVFQLFTPNERPVINGLNSVALNVGTAIISFSLASIMVLFNQSWQMVLITISLGSVIILILWLIFGADTAPVQTQKEKTYTMKDGLKEPFNWIFAFTYSGTLSFYLILLTFYMNIGIQNVAQNFLILGIVGTVAGIIVAKKSYYRLPILRISGIVQVLAIMGIHAQTWGLIEANIAPIAAIVAGFFIFLPMTSLILLAQERKGATAENLGVTFSLFWCISYVVGTFAPLIFGKLVDMHGGDFSVAFVFSTIMASTFVIGSFVLKETKEKKENS